MSTLSRRVTVQLAELLISSFLAREAAALQPVGRLGAERRSIFVGFAYRMLVFCRAWWS